MPPIRLLVIADPKATHMRLLKEIPDSVEITVTNDLDQLKAAAPHADVLVNGGFHSPLFRTIFPLATNLKWAHNMSAGVETVLSPEVVASPVPLTNGRGVFSGILAEFVITSVYFFAKDLRRMIRSQAAGKWEQFDTTEVRGRVMGIVGYGDIGRACAQLARAVGMRVIALRRRAALSQDDPALEQIYTRDQLEEMLSVCHYVAVATPHTPETRGMIGENEFSVMKPEAVIINVGRGPVIVEAALIEALRQNRIRGAALDVFDKEPLPDGHPFYSLENVLLSPHSADHLPGWIEMAMRRFLENFQRFYHGEPLQTLVDKQAGY